MFRRSTIVLTAFVLIGLLSACGAPAIEDTSSAVVSGSDADPSPASGAITLDNVAENRNEAAEQSSIDEAISVSPVPGDNNPDQLLMGFTEEGRPYIGDLSAPVRIDEFSDYQCPYCARFFTNTMVPLLETSIASGEAVIVFHDFPLAFHPQGIPAANAARCAGEQGIEHYWAMHDELFASIDRWGIDNPSPIFMELAGEIGLNESAFQECINLGRYVAEVEADIELGQSLGVTGTPTFFINDQPFVGAQPISAFEQAIARVLNGESIAEEQPSLGDVEIPPFEMPEQTELSDEYAAVLGDPEAPILIVELTDYQCPFCSRHSAQTMPAILSEMIETGRVRYALKDFPLDQIHPDARLASTAARCAGEQDAYWGMHDALFDRQSAWGQGVPDVTPFFQEMASDLQLDRDAFDECLASGRYDDTIQSNVDEGFASGVSGTPAFFIDGYFLSGAQPYQVFDLIVSNIEEGTIEQLFREAYEEQVQAYREQLAAEEAAQQPPEPVDVPLGDAFAIGSPDAPIVIVEYTDFQCPYCGRHFSQTLPQIKENYIDTGLVRYVFKDFPLDFHTEADDAAEAARCAGDQDAFLDMHTLLFDKQSEWGGSKQIRQVLIDYAADLNLDQDVFAECLLSGKYTEAVNADFVEGSSFGVTGTPSFFVNGNPLFGALPYTNFAQAIDSLLGEQQ